MEKNFKLNNCKHPLQLSWTDQYKVNKPLDQSGLYVDKQIADDLLNALINLKDRCEKNDPEFNLPMVNDAINNAHGII
jgi:hypothetical protein